MEQLMEEAIRREADKDPRLWRKIGLDLYNAFLSKNFEEKQRVKTRILSELEGKDQQILLEEYEFAEYVHSLPLNLRGHQCSGENLYSKFGGQESLILQAKETVLSGKRMKSIRSESPFISCHACKEDVFMIFNGKSIRASEPCQFGNGYNLTFTIPCPSGFMAVTDDLRPCFTEEEKLPSWREGLGAHIEDSLNFAKYGMAHCLTHNISPWVYEERPGKYHVIFFPNPNNHGVISKSWKKLCQIKTDLWWYSFMDWEDFSERKQRIAGQDKYLSRKKISKIEVPAGTYGFRHRLYEKGFRWFKRKPTIIATFELGSE